jgi:hypothetical protein
MVENIVSSVPVYSGRVYILLVLYSQSAKLCRLQVSPRQSQSWTSWCGGGGGGLINKEENTTKTSQTKEVFAGDGKGELV